MSSAAGLANSSWTGRDGAQSQQEASRTVRSIRNRLPRSQSTGNMLEAVGASFRSSHHEPRDINTDSNERGNLQELAKFFRTTAPPLSHASEHAQVRSGLEHGRKRSFQSFIKRRRNTKSGSHSVHLQPSERFVVKRSIEGYPYTTLPDPEEPIKEEAASSTHYPVFPGTHARRPSAPPQWPERTSSANGPLSPKTPTRASSTEPIHGMPQITEQSPASVNPELQPGNEDLKNFTEARVMATNFLDNLAAQHNSHGKRQTEKGDNTGRDKKEPVINNTHVPHSSPLSLILHKHGHAEGQNASVEFPATPPPSGQSQQFEWPEVVIKSPKSPAKSPETLLARRRQSSLTSLQMMHTSPKARGSPQLPPNAAAQRNLGGLAVPEENIMPESPGFPKMLAGMTFPSPPKTSRPTSAASNSTSGSRPSTAVSPPAVRPRTSSRNATMPPAGTISLNEIVMRSTRPGLSHSQSDYTLGDSTGPRGHKKMESVVATPSSVCGNSVPSFSPVLSPQDNGLSASDVYHARSESDMSYVTACDEQRASGTPSTFSEFASYRQSGSSIITTTTESHRRSTSTNLTNRQSTRSNATTISTSPSIEEGTSKLEDSATANVHDNPNWPLPADVSGDLLQRRVSSKSSNTSERHIENTPMAEHGSPKPMSIAERRIARHRPATEHREKLIDHTHLAARPNLRSAMSFDSVDSPVLGYFPHSVVPSRKASVHGPSPLAHISPLVAVTQGAEAESSQGENPAAPVDEFEQFHPATRIAKTMQKEVKVSPSNATKRATWSVSSLMATEIQPSEDPEPEERNDLAISALMIVAEVLPELVEEALPPSKRLSIIPPTSVSAVPHLPPKSPRRPKHTVNKRLSRQFPMPIRVNIPTADASGSVSNQSNVIERGGMPFPAPGTTPRAQKRMSLPIYMSGGARPVSWMPPSRLRESYIASDADVVEEPEPESPAEPEPETKPRRRSSVIKEKIQLAKLAREKEIADLVAQMAKPTTTASMDSYEDFSDSSESQACTTDDLEHRINVLEQNNGEWASMLNPLLTNMNRTLMEMKEGKLNPLLMNEFIIDMTVEARRSMMSSNSPQESEVGLRSPVTFEGFDGSHSPKPQPESRPSTAVRIKKSSLDQTLPRKEHVRVSTEQPQEPEVEEVEEMEEAEEPEEPTIAVQDGLTEIKVPSITDSAIATSPRTPQEHEVEIDRAIRKRILAQEVMMDELMMKWGLPSPRPSMDSSRSSAMTLPPVVGTPSQRHSKSSSTATIRPTHKKVAESDAMATFGDGALREAPINKHLLMDGDGLTGPGASRRGSRRWSSAGERMSWKPGDTGFMNVLMQELRSTSRLSLESGGDYEVWI
jgi:hypothetical protein